MLLIIIYFYCTNSNTYCKKALKFFLKIENQFQISLQKRILNLSIKLKATKLNTQKKLFTVVDQLIDIKVNLNRQIKKKSQNLK